MLRRTCSLALPRMLQGIAATKREGVDVLRISGPACRLRRLVTGASARSQLCSRLPRQQQKIAPPCWRQGKQMSSSLPPGRQLDNVLDTLDSRGMLHQLTAPNSLRRHVDGGVQRCVYVGVDPSADSLHVGNLLPLMAVLHFILHGHRAIILIGGATGSIGDPSGRDTERPALLTETLEENARKITAQVHDFVAMAGDLLARQQQASAGAFDTLTALVDHVQVVNNVDWYRSMNILSFLRDVGKMARISTMLARDSVKSRMEPAAVARTAKTSGDEAPGGGGNKASSTAPTGLSFTEFSYQLLQAYDFSVLHDEPWHCSIQLGGSDQMGNIMAGVDLIRRQRAQGEGEGHIDTAPEAADGSMPAYGLTLPLLTTSTGAKFGKSAGNAVWLDRGKCSHYDFYQYFYRARDDEVQTYLKALTLLPLEAIETIMRQHEQEPSRRHAQVQLASHVTELVRGRAALDAATTATRVLFGTDLAGLSTEAVEAAFEADPRLQRRPASSIVGHDVARVAADVGIVTSRGEARRAIQGGGLYLNGATVRDAAYRLGADDVLPGTRLVMLRRGRTDHRIVVLDEA